MNDNGQRRWLAGPVRPPEAIEHELVRLREDCAALVRELEGRYQRVMRVPRAVGTGARRVENAVATEARTHPVVLVSVAVAVGTVFVLWRFGVFERRVSRPRPIDVVDLVRARARWLLRRVNRTAARLRRARFRELPPAFFALPPDVRVALLERFL